MRVLFVLGIVAGCKLGFENTPIPDAPPDAPFSCPTNLLPSNGIVCALLGGAPSTLTGDQLVFDTDTGEITDKSGVVRAPGLGHDAGIGFFAIDEMGVFVAADIAVPATSTWTARGARAFVLFARTIDVAGTIDAGANDQFAGPHGTAGGTGELRTDCEGQTGPYKLSLSAGAGGGGGGGATSGGSGAMTAADAQGATAGGPGGTPCAQPSAIPLRGGYGGGPGGTENNTIMGGAGGGGGGALGLVAMVRVDVDGTLAVPGAGGQTIAGGSGGGGGGAGGAVFVESIDVAIRGAITANGGAGAPAMNATSTTARGERGHLRDALPAVGATNAGNGGAGPTLPTSGTTATAGGGGGGAVGWIEIKAVRPAVTGATFSPAPRMTSAALD